MRPMRIVCIGGGPAGLYFAILMKKADPRHHVTLIERNRAGDTFGWGVVFSDQTLENMRDGDEATQKRIIDNFAHWDDIEIHFKGNVVTSHGHGFCGIERRKLLTILQERARDLGVELVFEHEVADIHEFADADLIVAADGINSRVRAAYAEHFQPEIDWRRNKYVWLGTHRVFEAFTFVFVATEWGWFQAHAYRFDAQTSTFIVETREESWRAAGLDRADQHATLDFCRRLFAPWLDGKGLMAQPKPGGGSDWVNFARVANKNWVRGNLVLMGDAAHSAHFSIGSGTKLALEDAIALARAIQRHDDLAAALAAYETERRVEVLRLQSAARNSTEWFENVARYAKFPPRQFAYSLLTRSQRVSHENLRQRDKSYLERVERWLGERTTGKHAEHPVPPMFLPFRLKGMKLENRIVCSPMAMYSAKDGVPERFPPRPSWRARLGRRGPRLHRDDVRHGGRPHLARLLRPVERRAGGGLTAASSASCTRRRAPGSRCNSAIAAPRARPRSAGRDMTRRSMRPTRGPSSPPRPCRGARTTRCRAR